MSALADLIAKTDVASCPRCGFVGPTEAVRRHRERAGHELDEPQDETKGDDLEVTLVRKAAKPEQRYTFGVVRVPNDEAQADEFQDALWRFDYRTPLRKESGEVVGRIVEMAQWPYTRESDLMKSDGAVRRVAIPARAIYAGVVWTEDAWPDVKAGRISGLRLGDTAVRVVGVPT